MHQDTHTWISVHDVARAMNMALSNEQAWAVGKGMEKLWTNQVGTPPLKDNRTKKIGAGSHCFALYPATEEWRERIERWIRTVRANEDGQLSLF